MGQNNSVKRQQLFRLTPHCFWCGKLTRLEIEAKLKHDTATVDHLYSRLHPDRKAARRGRGRLVLACNQCNKDRSNAETRGLMFVPKIGHRKDLAELTTVTPLGAPVYTGSGQQPRRTVLNPPKPSPPKEDFGWIDGCGDLRPRDYEEYCAHRSAFIGPSFEDRPAGSPRMVKSKVKLKRDSLCTIGELLEHRSHRT